MAAHGIQHDSIQGSGHLFIRRACWEGAIVAYGRCFALGRKPGGKKRHTLFSYLKHLSDEQVETHHFVRALRNRRVGHHDQDGSGTTLDMYLTIGSLQGTHMEISDICVDYRGEFYDVELLARLEDLTQRLRELVGSRIDDLRFELQAELCADVGAVITAWRSATPLARPSSQG
jgi:hypothetical protein